MFPDALSQYSGDNPYQASTAYSDRFSGFGERAGRLIPGYDCPYHATYWNTTVYKGVEAGCPADYYCGKL